MSYEDLCKRVEKIDPEAAEYMRGEAKKLPDFSEYSNINDCFYWINTPQGFNYWWGIEEKLNGGQDMLELKIQEAMKVLKLSQRKLSAKLGKSENYLANINRENLSEKRKEEIIREIDCLLNGGQVKSDTQIIAELTQQVSELQDTNHELRTLYQKERQKVADLQEKLEIHESKIISYPNLALRNLKREYEDKLYSVEKAHCKFKRATWALIIAVLFLLCVLGLWVVV